MAGGQLTRVGLVAAVLVALAVGFGVGRATDDPGSEVGATPSARGGEPVDVTLTAADQAYVDVVDGLRQALTTYGARAQGVDDHEQVAGLEALLRADEVELARAAAAARALGTTPGDAAADLAELVADRAAQVRAAAVAEDTGATGVAAMQALGREASLRAVRLGAVLDELGTAADPQAVRERLEAEVAVPWPDAGEEGEDDEVPLVTGQ